MAMKFREDIVYRNGKQIKGTAQNPTAASGMGVGRLQGGTMQDAQAMQRRPGVGHLQGGGIGRLQGGTMEEAMAMQRKPGVGKLTGGTMQEAARQQARAPSGSGVGRLQGGTMQDAIRQQRKAASPGIGYGAGDWKERFMAENHGGYGGSGADQVGPRSGYGVMAEMAPRSGYGTPQPQMQPRGYGQPVGPSGYGAGGRGGMVGYASPGGPSGGGAGPWGDVGQNGGNDFGGWANIGGAGPVRPRAGRGFLQDALRIAGRGR